MMWQKKTPVPEWLLLIYIDILELEVQYVTFLCNHKAKVTETVYNWTSQY